MERKEEREKANSASVVEFWGYFRLFRDLSFFYPKYPCMALLLAS